MLERAITSSSKAEKETGGGEFQPDEPGNAAAEEPFLIVLRKLHDAFHVEGDCVVEEPKYLFEGSALYRQIQIKADRLPSIVSPEGVAMQDTLHRDLP
jgi:hypothetical protein